MFKKHFHPKRGTFIVVERVTSHTWKFVTLSPLGKRVLSGFKIMTRREQDTQRLWPFVWISFVWEARKL